MPLSSMLIMMVGSTRARVWIMFVSWITKINQKYVVCDVCYRNNEVKPNEHLPPQKS